MSTIKVMISGFYRGGAWTDRDTSVVFDPRKDEGKVFVFEKTAKLDSIMEAIAKHQLVPFDKLTAIEFEKVARQTPELAPQVVEVRGKSYVLEIVFDRPVHPIPGKYIHVPVGGGVVHAIPVVDAYMEGHVKAVFAVDAKGAIRIDAGAFIDDGNILSEAYPVEVKEDKIEEVVEEPVVEEPVEEVEEAEAKEVEAPKKKAPAKKRKKAEDTE